MVALAIFQLWIVAAGLDSTDIEHVYHYSKFYIVVDILNFMFDFDQGCMFTLLIIEINNKAELYFLHFHFPVCGAIRDTAVWSILF